MRRVLIGLSVAAGLAAVLSVAAIVFLPRELYFPAVRFEAPGGLRIEFLQPGERVQGTCAQKAEEVAAALRKSCPACALTIRCERGLSAEARSVMSREPLAVPSARRADGALTMTFHAPDAAVADAVCRESAKASAVLPESRRLVCYSAGSPR